MGSDGVTRTLHAPFPPSLSPLSLPSHSSYHCAPVGKLFTLINTPEKSKNTIVMAGESAVAVGTSGATALMTRPRETAQVASKRQKQTKVRKGEREG